MVFVVFDKVAASIDSGEEPTSTNSGAKKSRYIVSVHHSRDSAGKQWIATQSLVLRGLCRVLRNFFAKLLDSTDDGSGAATKKDDTPWFEDAWNRVLSYAFDAATQVGGRDTLDFRTAGSELLILCCQLSCREGIHAAITPARVGTNMEVVNGALRSVRSPDKNEGSSSKGAPRHSHSIVTEMWRENLFLDAFDALDSIREHLESDASNHNESGLHHTLEPTQVQVLSKFAEDMGKLYDCCKNTEFAEERSFDSVEDFEQLLLHPRARPGEGDLLVTRFVQIIATVAMGSASSPDARFLSQAQRSCMDILRAMASDGSPEALLTLVELSDEAFILERDENGKAMKGVDMLSYEASMALEEIFSKDGLSDETRVLVTYHILATFPDELSVPELQGVGLSYKLLILLVTSGLRSGKKLQEKLLAEPVGPKAELLVALWDKMVFTLNRVLTPNNGTPRNQQSNEVRVLTIPNAADLAELVKMVAEMTPPRFGNNMCTILAEGTAKCLGVAKEHPSEKEDVLKLFAACFRGVCRIDPKSRALQAVAQQVLTSTLAIISDKNKTDDPLEDAQVQACLIICPILHERGDKNDGGAGLLLRELAIAVFPQLCQLVGSEVAEVRKVAGEVLAKVDVGCVIAESDALRLSAEERAVVAEIQVVELTQEVTKLREEKEALERQLALI